MWSQWAVPGLLQVLSLSCYVRALRLPSLADARAEATLLHNNQRPLASSPIQKSHGVWDLRTLRGHLESALETMQREYFEVWIGQWPTSIDWTGAVLGTHISSTLSILSQSYDQQRMKPSSLSETSCGQETRRLEDLVNRYFSQIQAYYFGQDAFAIRLQAHDDKLWVVLGWLDALKLIDKHDSTHFSIRNVSGLAEPQSTAYQRRPDHRWHGTLFTPAFAHRSHVFYNIVSSAWDRNLCGGGLTWNPNLEPYKNAITNEQFISAAVGMYLYHPGDANKAPFVVTNLSTTSTNYPNDSDSPDATLKPSRPHEKAYLDLAIEAYNWLHQINMTNAKGLYVDGYHLRSHWSPHLGRRVYDSCDLRNEMLYTYNQGVILSGLRQLWEATGNVTYLEQGHRLVRNVVAATGWPRTERTGWQGLGYNGILSEFCDPSGGCSQDAQTFKGIFFHHFALFCEPLPTEKEGALLPGKTFVAGREVAALHARRCRGYLRWVERNAWLAWGTRDSRGIMGGWWGAPRWGTRSAERDATCEEPGAEMGELGPRDFPEPELPAGANDWRNDGYDLNAPGDGTTNDFNDRGRGRTVESHSSGLAVLRALYALRVHYE